MLKFIYLQHRPLQKNVRVLKNKPKTTRDGDVEGRVGLVVVSDEETEETKEEAHVSNQQKNVQVKSIS